MMRTNHVLRTFFVACACVFSLVLVVGCSPAASSDQSVANNAAAGSASSSASEQSAASSASASEVSSAAESESSNASASAATSASEATGLSEEQAVAQGYQVLKGTVRVMGAEELIKQQGVDVDPSAVSNGGTYAVLIFDAETKVNGMYSDGSGEGTRESKMLGIGENTTFDTFVVEYGDLELWKSLDGQQVKVATKAEDVWFPSDARLPLGEPYSKSVQLVS